MPLINCPECNTRVSDQANKCPQCAYPIKSNNEIIVKNNDGCFLQTLNFGCMLIVVTIGVIFLFIFLISIFS